MLYPWECELFYAILWAIQAYCACLEVASLSYELLVLPKLILLSQLLFAKTKSIDLPCALVLRLRVFRVLLTFI